MSVLQPEPELTFEEGLQPDSFIKHDLNPGLITYTSKERLRRWYSYTCNAILCQAVHFPGADVQLQWEERVPLGSGPKWQHSSVQALQRTGKFVQKEEEGTSLDLSLLITDGPIL